MTVITAIPREAVRQQPVEAARLHHRRGFGVPIPAPLSSPQLIDTNNIAVKDPSLERPVLLTDGVKYDGQSNSGLLFGDNNPHTPASTSDSTESPSLFSNPKLVSNTTVSPSTIFGNNATHTISPVMDASVSGFNFNGASASLNSASGTFTSSYRCPNAPDSDLAMKKLFDECLVGEFEEDSSVSFLFTPYTNATSFTRSTLTSTVDTPSISLAQLDSYMSATSFGDQDFPIFDADIVNTDEWTKSPLFIGTLDEPNLSYASIYKDTSATLSSVSPQLVSFPTIGDELNRVKSEILPSPALSPQTTRKSASSRRTSAPSARSTARKVSSTPFTPITPAPTTPSTPQPVVSYATKRRIAVVNEDPAVIEKRRRNTVAAQRSRARKAEEKAEDKARIQLLEKENENIRTLLSYWKDRACELGASPLEDGEI